MRMRQKQFNRQAVLKHLVSLNSGFTDVIKMVDKAERANTQRQVTPASWGQANS